MEEREEFLTARQLAQVLQVSESTVRRLARKRRIPSVRLTPRIVRFIWMQSRGVGGAPVENSSWRMRTESMIRRLSFDDLHDAYLRGKTSFYRLSFAIFHLPLGIAK